MTTINCRILLRNCKLLKSATTIQPRSTSVKWLSTTRSSSSQLGLIKKCSVADPTFFSDFSSQLHRKYTILFARSLITQVPRPYVHPKLSYTFARSNEHLVYSTVASEFDKKLKERPDDVVYICHAENKQVTFRQLAHDVNKVTKALVKKFDVSRGDYVGVFAYNCYNWIVVQFACTRIGAILTPINPSYKSSELAYILNKGKVKCLFMPGPKSVQSELNNHLSVLQSDEIIEMSKNGDIKLSNVIFMDQKTEYTISDQEKSDTKDSISFKLVNCRLHNWSSTENDGLVYKSLQEAEEAGHGENVESVCVLNPDELSPDDIFAVYYTSGTTGKPKGASISQFTALNNVRLIQMRIRHGRPKDWKVTCASVLPMFHIFAGVLISIGPLVNHTTAVYSTHKYDIKAFVESICKHQANMVALTPTILIDLISYVEKHKITEFPLRVVQSGGAALSPETVHRAFKILPNLEELKTGYGSTENGSLATCTTGHEPAETRAHTVGPPIDFCEIRVVKPNTDELVPHGVKGEIQTRGYNTMVEYLDDPDKTAEVITTNRWYRTGDVGFLHPHGSLQISGRLKHMIIKGGENIYCEEVEQLIHKLNYVEDAHVVGVPDKRYGEQVCAWVKLKPGYKEAKTHEDQSSDCMAIHKDAIIDFCKENITYFKVPKYLFFVEDFPMTPTKKVQHHLMTKLSCEWLGIEQK